MLLKPPEKIYIASSNIPNGGRGVFAGSIIKEGEVIEHCPVVKIPSYEEESLNQTSLVGYTYYLGKNKDHPTIVLGYGSIYNHSYKPNARYNNESDDFLDFIAIKDIQEGEEITVNYNQDNQNDKTPMWFEVK